MQPVWWAGCKQYLRGCHASDGLVAAAEGQAGTVVKQLQHMFLDAGWVAGTQHTQKLII